MTLSAPPSVQDDQPSADHPALDFINTLATLDGEPVDSFQSDDDVLRWLDRAGWPIDKEAISLPQSSLLEIARALRLTIRVAMERRKAGEQNAGVMNVFLMPARSNLMLVPDEDGRLRLEREWQRVTAEQILSPVTESAAELLVSEDFNLVKRCENAGCGFWFYDRTRSHHRRWCRMSVCGNRNKVAKFRKQRSDS